MIDKEKREYAIISLGGLIYGRNKTKKIKCFKFSFNYFK